MVLEVAADGTESGLKVEALGAGIAEPYVGYRFANRAFADSMAFVKKFNSSPLARYETVTRIAIDRLGNVSLWLGEGPEVRLGRRPRDVFGALAKATALIQGEGRKKIDYVDLQFENVIVKQKRGGR